MAVSKAVSRCLSVRVVFECEGVNVILNRF